MLVQPFSTVVALMLNITMGQVTGDDLWAERWRDTSVPGLLRSKVRNPATFL